MHIICKLYSSGPEWCRQTQSGLISEWIRIIREVLFCPGRLARLYIIGRPRVGARDFVAERSFLS